MGRPFTLPSYRRIGGAEEREKRAKGLCFKCDTKYMPRHRCTPGHRCTDKTLNSTVMYTKDWDNNEDRVDFD